MKMALLGFRVFWCLLICLWITDAYRDGDQGEAVLEAAKDAAERHRGNQKATLESVAVGTASFQRQKPKNHGDVTVTDAEDEDDEQSAKEHGEESEEGRGASVEDEKVEDEQESERSWAQDRELEDVVREEEEKERERREQAGYGEETPPEGSAFVEEEPKADVSQKRHKVLYCSNIDIRGTGCNGDPGDRRLNHPDNFVWQIWRGKGADDQRLIPLGLLRMLSTTGKGAMTLGLMYMSVHIMAPAGIENFHRPSYFSYFTAVLFSSTATLVLGGLFEKLEVTSKAFLWWDRKVSSPSYNLFEQASQDAFRERQEREHGLPGDHLDASMKRKELEKERTRIEQELNQSAQAYLDKTESYRKGPQEFDDIARMPEACGEVQFTDTFGGKHPDGLYLSTIEKRSDVKASRAIVEYCNAMDSGGASAVDPAAPLWAQKSVMPKPSVCMENSKPSWKRKSRAPSEENMTPLTSDRAKKFSPPLGVEPSDYWFKCYDMLRLANEELLFQTTQTQFLVVKEMVDHQAAKANVGVCQKKYEVQAPTNMMQQACAEEGQERQIQKMLDAREAEDLQASGEEVQYHTTQDTVNMSSLLQFDEQEELSEEEEEEEEEVGDSKDFEDNRTEGIYGRRRKKAASAQDAKTIGGPNGKRGDWEREHRRRCWFFCQGPYENLLDTGRNYAEEQGVAFDPETRYEPPLSVTVDPQQKAKLIRAIRAKDEALHDCLSVTSCQLLRKDTNTIQGMSRKWYTLGLYRHRTAEHNLMPNIIRRCLGHSELVGPEYQHNCEGCPAKLLGGARNALRVTTKILTLGLTNGFDMTFAKTGVCDVFGTGKKVKNHHDKRKRSIWRTAKRENHR